MNFLFLRIFVFTNYHELLLGDVAVPSIMYAMEVIDWTADTAKKLETIQNGVGRIALAASRYTGVEAIRGDMGWSTFEERLMKNQLEYKIRLERMNNKRYARKVYNEIGKGGKWIQSCGRNVKKCGLKKN